MTQVIPALHAVTCRTVARLPTVAYNPCMLLQLHQATPTAAYPGDCLLSIGCRTDRRRDWLV